MPDPYQYLNQEANRTAQNLGALQQSVAQTRMMQLRQQQQLFDNSLQLRQIDMREKDMMFDQSIKQRQLDMEEKLQPLKMKLAEEQIQAASRTGNQRYFKDQVRGLRDASIDPTFGVDTDDTINGELRKQAYEKQYNQLVTQADDVVNEGVALPTDQEELPPELSLMDDREDDPLTRSLRSMAPPSKAPAPDKLSIMEAAVKRAERGIKGGSQEERLAYMQDLYIQHKSLVDQEASKGNPKAIEIATQRETEARLASQLLTNPNVAEGPKVAARNTLIRLGLSSDRIDADIVKAAGKEAAVQQYDRQVDIAQQRYREYQDLKRDFPVSGGPGETIEPEQVKQARLQWEAAKRAAEDYGSKSGVIPATTGAGSTSAAQQLLDLAKARLNR